MQRFAREDGSSACPSFDRRCGFSGCPNQPETGVVFFSESEGKRQTPKTCLPSSATESNTYAGMVRECGPALK